MRGAGVGDAAGDGTGVGVGVCADVSRGSFVAVIPATPSAGSSFTKERRVVLVFFIVLFVHRNHRSSANTLRARFAVLDLQNLRFAKPVDRDDVEVVVFTFGNRRIRVTAQ